MSERAKDSDLIAETLAAPLKGGTQDTGVTGVTRGTLLAGRYELLGLLGVGGMGAVYRARDATLDEVVALKVLRREIARDPDATARFRSEVKLARRVTHANVARTFDIGEVKGELFLTMELVGGESLGSRLSREKLLSPAETARIAVQIVDGLVAAHASGVVHRDLKPDNVMLDGDRVVITDFGVARATTGAARSTVGVTGTPAYMAPEQVEGRPDVDGRADFYALGVMLWEMLTGALPFAGDSAVSVAAARLLRDAPDVRSVAPNVPSAAAHLVARLLSRDREERGTPEQIIAALASFTSHERSAPPPPRRPERDERRARTVAVLPFTNRGGEEDTYLAEGLAEEVADALSMTEGLRVRPFGRVRAQSQLAGDARDIGRTLDVQVVVEGTIRREGQGLRMTMRLVTVDDGFQLWAKRFALQPGDISGAADEVADEVAKALTAQRGERPAAVSAKAYDLYLRAKHICDRWVGPHADGVRLLEEAQALAPDDPRIAGRLAMELARATGAVTHPSDIALTKARAMAAHAQRLNPTRADPAVARAILHWHWSELEACVAALDDALAIDREDAEALAMLGRLLAEAGSAKEGLILLRRATVADPELATARVAIHRTLALMEDWDHAAPELGVPKPRADVGISYARGLLWRRDVEGARALVDALPAMDIAALAKNWTVGLLSPLFGPIDVERVRQALPLDVGAPSRVAFFAQLRAEAFAIGDMLELAIDSAEAADANGTLDVLWMDRCPALTAIRNEPRFVAVAARTFARAQRVHGRLLALAARIG